MKRGPCCEESGRFIVLFLLYPDVAMLMEGKFSNCLEKIIADKEVNPTHLYKVEFCKFPGLL